MEDLVAIMEALGARLDQLHLTLHATHPQGDQVREAKELAIKGIVLARQIQSANVRRDQALALLTWHAGSKSGAIGGR